MNPATLRNLIAEVREMGALGPFGRQRAIREVVELVLRRAPGGLYSGRLRPPDLDDATGDEALAFLRAALELETHRPPHPSTFDCTTQAGAKAAAAWQAARAEALRMLRDRWPERWSEDAFDYACRTMRFIAAARIQDTEDGEETVDTIATAAPPPEAP